MNDNSNSILTNMTEHDLSGISDRIIYLRQNILKYSQSQFASFIKISQTYLSLIESGKKNVNTSIVQKIITTFNINSDWLLYGTGDGDNIFQSCFATTEFITSLLQNNILDNLQKAYSLKNEDMLFLAKYLSYTRKEKDSFLAALDSIKKLF